MRAVGTRPTRPPGRVPKGTPTVAVIAVPAIEMAGYPCQMPTASAAQILNCVFEKSLVGGAGEIKMEVEVTVLVTFASPENIKVSLLM